MNALRALAALIVLGLAIVFLLTGACPRKDEREELPPAEILTELGDPDSVDLEPERESLAAQPAEREIQSAGSGEGYELIVYVQDAEEGEALEEAVIEISFQGAQGQASSFKKQSGADGDLRLPGLPANTYTIVARKRGYFKSNVVHLRIPGEENEVELELIPAGSIIGRVITIGGQSVSHGLMRFTHTETQTKRLGQLGRRGRFESPPLEAGTWQVCWLPHEHAEADVRTIANLPITARDERELEFTLDWPNTRPKAGLEIGVKVLR